VLLAMLRLDFVYARLSDVVNASPIEMIRLTQRRNLNAQAEEVGQALNRWLGGVPCTSLCVVPNPIGEGEISIVPLRLGLQNEASVLVAGSQRADVPTAIEMLLLRVAVNQAAIGLQGARRLSEQRRAAQELEQRVVERTSQLTAVNEELNKEIIERRHTEQRLAAQHAITRVLAESDSVADAMPHLLQAIGEGMDWEWGALWNVDRDAGVMRCASIWYVPHLEASEFDAIGCETVAIPGLGRKSHVWQSSKPIWIDDIARIAPHDARPSPHCSRTPLRRQCRGQHHRSTSELERELP
jgi:hypothetical protein